MKQLQKNTREFTEAYNTLKTINNQLNNMETMEDVEQFIDDTLSISVVYDIYNHVAYGFIIDIAVGGPYIHLDTMNNVLMYTTVAGSLTWYPQFEKIKLIDDYINDYLYQI